MRLLFALLLFSSTAMAQVPLKSFAMRSPDVACTGYDQLMPLDGDGNTLAPPAIPSSMPEFAPKQVPLNFKIRIACISHSIRGDPSFSWALIGHSGPNGDHTSPVVHGTGVQCLSFPADAPVVFTHGEYLDVHAGCVRGTHWVMMQIWYTD
jgi:hypothetical protein